MLDPIVNNQITIKDADSIGRNAYSMFHLLVHLASIQESNINYSMYRYINNYCIDVIRKINEELNQQGIFNLYSPEELFTLMCYGHKECTTSTFTHLLESISKKLSGTMVNSTIVAGIDKEKLKELIVYCDKNNTLKELLNLVDDDKKNYLLALTAEEERNVLFPMLKVFRTDTVPQDFKSK